MLTGDLKKELINVLTPIVSAHQEKRKTVTNQDVLDFMSPRQLNFNVQPVFKVVAPFLDQECLDKLDQHLKDHSYVHGHQLSEVDVILASHIDNFMTFVYIQRWLSHVKSCDDKPLSITKDIKKDIFTSYGDY